MELRYAEAGRRYHLDVCVAQAEEMFRAAIAEAGTAVEKA